MRRVVWLLGLMMLSGVPARGAHLAPATEWDRARAAHLLRRAGFSGTPEEIDRYTAMGMSAAVDALIDYEKTPQTDPDYIPVRGPDRDAMRDKLANLDDEARREVFDRLQRLDRQQIEELRAWWVRRMIVTPRPLEERMTLFWHGHFTSGHREVRDATMMADQNALFRRYALGNFKDLLVDISQDPAMLRYLDNASNRKQAPNENFARELLELFTLGEGNYTEQDIKEAARSLTGWTLRGKEFREARGAHDRGEKTFLGETGNFNGNDIIDIVLKQEAAPRHLARKLLVYFVRDDPSAYDVEALAGVIRAYDFNLREVMRALFKSAIFYDQPAMFSRVKSPVDLVVGTFRVLEIPPVDLYGMSSILRSMGQDLFQPPNVKGWDGGRKWANTATIFIRYNFATGILTGTESRGSPRMMVQDMKRLDRLMRHRDEVERNLADYPGLELPPVQVEPEVQPAYDPRDLIKSEDLSNANRALNHLIDRVLQMDVDPRQRKYLRSLLTEGGRYKPGTSAGRQKIVSLINALLTMPEYQVK